ncbi:MAG TPA: sigma factor, partial [Candidatus Glassbacteria bacterium]|nr:sigma factor [Candidatus Glassbacteria bacterium]
MKNYSENNIDAMYESYFKDANQFELISRKKEKELAAKIQAGCEESLNDLIQANLKLVITIAHKFSYQKCDFMDLISEGNIGLRKAALKFDPIKAPDARFSTYASW